MKAKSCVVCGCTEHSACVPHGCMWITLRPRLCSGCFAFLMNLRDPRTLARVLQLFDLASVRGLALADPAKAAARKMRRGVK